MSYKFLLVVFFLAVQSGIFSQVVREGKVVRQSFVAASLSNNKAGEAAKRDISIYLPPGYEQGTQRYPVIYFLHGFGMDDKEMFSVAGLKMLMDHAISSGALQPMLLVIPNSKNRYGGSFYTNSPVLGNWADFIGKDVVAYTDNNFRTIASTASRGLAGHSMGGNGSLKLAMMFADVFGSVYAMSPAVLEWGQEFTVANRAFKTIGMAKTEQEILKGLDMSEEFNEQAFFAVVFTAMGRVYAPELQAGFIQTELPVRYVKDSAIVNLEVIKKWEANFPMNMINYHLSQLKSLTALKIDWGRNEEFAHIPATALRFSKKLEAYGIRHFAEEYIGDHTNMVGRLDGRFFTDVLPFFNTYLSTAK